MIERVVSGGQRGVDQAALRAARAEGFATGGWAPKGWLIESACGRYHDSDPTLIAYGLRECPEGRSPSERYAARRRACVADADVCLLLGDATSPGSIGLLRDAQAKKPPLPVFLVRPGETRPSQVLAFLAGYPRAKVLLVAGNRESRAPGIGKRAESFLRAVFKQLRQQKE